MIHFAIFAGAGFVLAVLEISRYSSYIKKKLVDSFCFCFIPFCLVNFFYFVLITSNQILQAHIVIVCIFLEIYFGAYKQSPIHISLESFHKNTDLTLHVFHSYFLCVSKCSRTFWETFLFYIFKMTVC